MHLHTRIHLPSLAIIIEIKAEFVGISPTLGIVAQTVLIYFALVSNPVAHLSVGRIAITELQAQVLSQGLRQVDSYGIGTIGGGGVLVLVAIKHGIATQTALQLIVSGLGKGM